MVRAGGLLGVPGRKATIMRYQTTTYRNPSRHTRRNLHLIAALLICKAGDSAHALPAEFQPTTPNHTIRITTFPENTSRTRNNRFPTNNPGTPGSQDLSPAIPQSTMTRKPIQIGEFSRTNQPPTTRISTPHPSPDTARHTGTMETQNPDPPHVSTNHDRFGRMGGPRLRKRDMEQPGRSFGRMNVDEMVQLVGSGNYGAVELEWLAEIENTNTEISTIIDYAPVLDEMMERNKTKEAESLAWTTVATLSDKRSPEEAIKVAKAFLLRLKQATELKAQITELYRKIFADRDNLETLIEIAGIEGSRPPRRAIRTLDTCLAIQPGTYCVSRDDDQAIRIESIDPDTWEITINLGDEEDEIPALELADRHVICSEHDYRVLARFDRERLQKMLASDPARIIEDILVSGENEITGDELEELLVPDVIEAGNWTKWWTKARSAVRKSEVIKIEGRSPYVLSITDAGETHATFEKHFKHLEGASAQLDALENYVKLCKNQSIEPVGTILEHIRETAMDRAKRAEAKYPGVAFAEYLVSARISQEKGDSDAEIPAIELVQRFEQPAKLLRECTSAALWDIGIDVIAKAKPESAVDIFLEAMPFAPANVCSDLADRIEAADVSDEKIASAINFIVTEAVACADALCWLWDKGLKRPKWQSTISVTVLRRVIWLMGEIKRNDTVKGDREKEIRATIRTILSARKYERFLECIKNIEPGMADALRTDIKRLDSLGRNLHEDLLNRLQEHHPKYQGMPDIPRWEKEDTLYATEYGISRFRNEINELVNIKMKENAKAIGDAAEKGDLSENSEYKFALEERDLLRARLAQMNSQMAKAQAIQPEDVPVDHVDIGSVATLENVENGKTLDITFLSPFEADVEKCIYNYQSPLGQEFMGKHIGDKVELPMPEHRGTYKISALRPWTTS